jgi:hypothetical protein
MSSIITYTLTGLDTVSTVQQGGYTYVKIGPSGSSYTGTIQFTSPEPFILYCLLVGGGGSGGGGWQDSYTNFSGFTYTFYLGGGGGGGGEVTPCQILVTSSLIFNLTIGQGGIGEYYEDFWFEADGTETTITETVSGSFFTAGGGSAGTTALSVASIPVYGAGGSGINNSGTGGLGGIIVYKNLSILTNIPSSGAVNYNQLYNNYNFNNYTIPFAISGGGGGGTSSVDPQNPNPGNGSGGAGGYYDGSTIISPISGINGAGGGGGTYPSIKTTSSLAGNGGDGFIYLSYPNNPIGTLSKFNVVNVTQDLSTIFFPLNLGGIPLQTDTGYIYYDTNSSTYKDIRHLYASYTPGSVQAIQTEYLSTNYSNKDLNQLFQNINYIPIPYNIISSSNCSVTFYSNIYNSVTYFGVVINQNGPINIAGGDIGVNGLATLSFISDIPNVYIIVVGGGGGGGGGNLGIGGGGGGGGGVTYVQSTSIKKLENVTIKAGCAGGGRNPGYQGGGGNDSGAGGSESSISYKDINNNTYEYISYGGGAGLGSGTASGYGGGPGGGTTTTGGNSNYGGGGGGGGGGGTNSGSGSVCTGGSGGKNSVSGNPGVSGEYQTGNPIIKNVGGDGGNSWFTSVLLPFYNNGTTIYLGGGGGGGGLGAIAEGGNAGNGTGGAGNGNPSQTGNGTSANNSLSAGNPGFGGGGGGGGSSGTLAGGGDGGNGVVIIWWNY